MHTCAQLGGKSRSILIQREVAPRGRAANGARCCVVCTRSFLCCVKRSQPPMLTGKLINSSPDNWRNTPGAVCDMQLHGTIFGRMSERPLSSPGHTLPGHMKAIPRSVKPCRSHISTKPRIFTFADRWLDPGFPRPTCPKASVGPPDMFCSFPYSPRCPLPLAYHQECGQAQLQEPSLHHCQPSPAPYIRYVDNINTGSPRFAQYHCLKRYSVKNILIDLT